jgi:Protein kinase domain
MDDDSALLDDLAASIADGELINWDKLEKLPGGAELRQLIQNYRIVAGVADVHRSPDPDLTLPTGASDRTREGEGRQAPPGTAPGIRRWGHLQLLRKIGEGAFGEVYHAHDLWLDHSVALKLLKLRVGPADHSLRIVHEARKLARVRHPNVVSIHGADSHDGQVGFWMDLVEGVTLAEQVRNGPLSAGEATHVGREVCRALAAVHKAKIVHRDIKAQNVMRASDDGRILLMDFGAGEFVGEVPVRSGAGTPLYLAPEILYGGSASVQSDVYALGVLLFFLVSATYPFIAASIPDLIDAHRSGQRRPLRDLRPDLPEAFIAVVERAINPDPALRYASAGAIEAALAQTVHPAPLPAAAIDEPDIRRRIQTIAAGGLAVLALTALISILGALACGVFNYVLRVEPEFSAGPRTYLSVGLQGVFPFVVFWLAGAAVIGVGAALRPLFRPALNVLASAWARLTEPVDPATIGAIVFLGSVGAGLAITWVFADIYNTTYALREAAGDQQIDLSALSTLGSPLSLKHGYYTVFVTFVLGFAALRWFPRLEARASHPGTLRSLRWATVVVVLLMVALNVAPRRLIWEDFEIVVFQQEPAFVIASSADELLLYAPRRNLRTHWRVRKDAPDLRRAGTTGRLFSPQ